MKHILRNILLWLLLATQLFFLPSCSTNSRQSAHTALPSAKADLPAQKAELIDGFFPCSSHELLFTYGRKTEKDFEKACKTYETQGFVPYSSSEIGGNLAKTYTKGKALAHLYYHPAAKELNVVLSDTGGGSLPPAVPAVTSGNFECTVTQLGQAKIGGNGMGYVIRLQDGSFLIYDGGYESSADEILEILREQSQGETPVVRAWILTHFHNDHYTAFHEMAQRAKKQTLFTLETVIASPIVKGYRTMLAAFSQNITYFPGARFVFAHTGMQFTFCNLTLEILYTPESLYKTGAPVENFNDTSIVSRLRDEKGSMLFTGDVALAGAALCETLYGDALRSDMVQMSHHGLEDCPLSFYEKVKASVLWYPCATNLYASHRNKEVRDALEMSPTTCEILIAGNGRVTRPLQK